MYIIVDWINEQVYTNISEQEFIIMAQILKDNVRKLILDSAMEDIIDNGVKDSSMRRIAGKAEMTVGNLYRYFKNKDELVNVIIQPVVDRLNKIVYKYTKHQIDLNDKSFDLSQIPTEAIYNALDELSVELVELNEKHPRPLAIMMNYKIVSDGLLNWFSEIIKEFMKDKGYIHEANQNRCDLLSKAYAVSLFAGVKECLLNSKLEKKELSEVILQSFYRSY